MKRCPQCRAEYDDHVQFCFVDGTELRIVQRTGSPAGVVFPPPVTAPSRSSPRTGEDRPSEVDPSGWTRPVTGMVGIVLTAIGGVGIIVLAAAVLVVWPLYSPPSTADGRRIEPNGDPVAALPAPEPPLGADPRAPVAMIHFTSDPPGAAVYEADKRLCTTPCDVEHPDYAPRERTFVLKVNNFTPVDVVVTDPATPQFVRLKPTGSRTTKATGRDDAPLDLIPNR